MISSESAHARAAAVLSELPDTVEAARDVCRRALAELGAAPNLAIAFASFHHQPKFGALGEILHGELPAACLLGCTGESIVCNQREIEGGAALVLWLACLGDTTIAPLHLEFEATSEGGTITGWPDDLDEPPEGASLMLLAEPFSFPADVLLARLNDDQPRLHVVGGMASGGWGPGQNGLLLNDRHFNSGAVGVLLHGATRVRSVVSQGCRPIGRPLVVTKAEGNVILELGGRPALAQLQELFESLTPDEQEVARQGLHVGQVINEYQDHFGRGDFLVRNVQGADPESGAIGVGDFVRVGQTVQFHVRDAQTADEDLNAMLSAAKSDGASDCLAALLFTCNGRGTRLFDGPDHDALALARHWQAPSAGKVFCTASQPAWRCLRRGKRVNDAPRGRRRARKGDRRSCRGR
jgi:small ligand-binding sensory domain FIST